VRLDAPPGQSPPGGRKAPPASERRLWRGGSLRQADLSLTSTLSLRRPVTGSLFCF
jgi:hypothetical protein